MEVKKQARRMLPALSRSCFSALLNTDDFAAAEVQSILSRAWLSRVSELNDSFMGEEDVGEDLPDPQDVVRPWHIAKDLLRLHVAACKVREGERAC